MELKNKSYCYIVEGKTDEDKLKKLGVRFVVKTNGKFIKREILENIKRIAEHRNIVLVLDPDPVGQQIRVSLEERLNYNCIVIKTKMYKSHDKNKIGIAQMKMNDLKDVLNQCLIHDEKTNEKMSIEKESLIELGCAGPNSKLNRELIMDKLKISCSSTKEFLSLLQMMEVTKEDIKNLLVEE